MKCEKSFVVRRMTPSDYEAVVALWRATPGIGLDKHASLRA